MNALSKRIWVGLMAALLLHPLAAQRGGLNYAPRPAVYSVVSVDVDARLVRLRASDGRTGDVYVADEVFDVSTLKSGDKVRVDFLMPNDAANEQLRAASVWLEK